MKNATLLALVLAASCARGAVVNPMPESANAPALSPRGTCTVEAQKIPDLGNFDFFSISGADDYSSSSSSSYYSDPVWVVGQASKLAIAIYGFEGKWVESPVVEPSTVLNGLYGVDVVSRTDVWAVGEYVRSNLAYPLVEHFDGKRWKVVSTPSGLPYGGYLYRVNAFSADDVWAVGGFFTSQNNTYRPLIEHWDGRKWSIESDRFKPLPRHDYILDEPPIFVAKLKFDVAPMNEDVKHKTIAALAVRANETAPWSVHPLMMPKSVTISNVNGIGLWGPGGNVIAVGSYGLVGQSLPQPMVQIWNGHTFDEQTLPKIGFGSSLEGVAFGRAGAFAYGSYYPKSSVTSEYALGLSYDGKSWKNLGLPKIGGAFTSAAPVPGKTDFWVVGNQFDFKSNSSKGFVDVLKCPVF